MHSDFSILFCRPGPGSTMEDSFELEADVVDDLGIETHVINADLLLEDAAEQALLHLPSSVGPLLYRGPILTAEEYDALYEAAYAQGAELIVDREAYEHALYIPQHHEAIADLSPPTVWTESPDIDEAYWLARELGEPPWLLKDHVKSAKEYWDKACFIPKGATEADFRQVADALLEFRGERFARGFVVRKFLDLAPTGVRTPERRIPDEHRLFFWNEQLVAHAPYLPVGKPLSDPSPFEHIGSRIASPFFTADVAFLNEGGWVIIEINDGGVSTLPEDLHPRDLYRALAG